MNILNFVHKENTRLLLKILAIEDVIWHKNCRQTITISKMYLSVLTNDQCSTLYFMLLI